MKAIGIGQNQYGRTFCMFVYACCLYHANTQWKKDMGIRFPEMDAKYVRPVRLHEHRLSLPEVYYDCRPCIERGCKV